MQDLALLPQTVITAKTMLGHVQLVIDSNADGLKASLRGNVGGQPIQSVERQLPPKATAFAKAGLLGPLLQQGMKHLNPEGSATETIDMEVIVNDGGEEHRKTFQLPVNMAALSQFGKILEMVRFVNAQAES